MKKKGEKIKDGTVSEKKVTLKYAMYSAHEVFVQITTILNIILVYLKA